MVLRRHCDQIELEVNLHVPKNAADVRAVFDRLEVEYQLIADLDESNAAAVSKVALCLDCDLVLSSDANALREVYSDEFGLVAAEVKTALHVSEIHLKGFNAPWSFERPAKNMPWSNFYLMSESSTFDRLLREHAESKKAGTKVHEVMRSLVADALPSLCFSRDRLEFYRQQDRWAQRTGLQHQDFGTEYSAYLNHFYLTLYAAVDQVAALIVHLYNLDVPESEIGATYKAFRNARKPYTDIDSVFSDKAFWEMYELPKLIRHRAAHRGPVKPQDVYLGKDDFTDEQLDECAEKERYLDDLNFFEKRGRLSKEMRGYLIQMARFKAKLKLLGPPRRHGVFLKNGKNGLFYYPDPARDLAQFIEFFDRVLTIIKPWDEVKESI